MTELIWISDWQIQCCGSEFAVGDEATWPVFEPDANRGDMGIAGITGYYDSHEDEPLPMMSGVVRRIRTASRSDSLSLSLPPELRDVTAIEKWYGIDETERRFRGWLVDLEVSG